MENKTITITEEQLAKATIKANDNFISELSKVGELDSTKRMASTLQNVLFSAELAGILFGENKGEE